MKPPNVNVKPLLLPKKHVWHKKKPPPIKKPVKPMLWNKPNARNVNKRLLKTQRAVLPKLKLSNHNY